MADEQKIESPSYDDIISLIGSKFGDKVKFRQSTKKNVRSINEKRRIYMSADREIIQDLAYYLRDKLNFEQAKKNGFSDKYLSQLLEVSEDDIRNQRIAIGVEEATLISRVGNTFNFKLKIKDLEMYDHYLYEDENIKEEDCYFEDEVAMEYINNRLVISKFNDSIILEGVYSLENTDVAYEFYKDGTVEYLMNMGVYTGTYDMSGEKELTITWKEETVWDVITSEEKTSEMTGKETVTVINDKKIRVESEHDGEVVINEFIKK